GASPARHGHFCRGRGSPPTARTRCAWPPAMPAGLTLLCRKGPPRVGTPTAEARRGALPLRAAKTAPETSRKARPTPMGVSTTPEQRRLLLRPLLFIAAAGLTGLAALAAPADAPLFGFSGEQSARERSAEQRFDGALRAEQLREWLKTLAAEPNHVGSPH